MPIVHFFQCSDQGFLLDWSERGRILFGVDASPFEPFADQNRRHQFCRQRTGCGFGGKSGRFADKAAGQLFWAECRLQVERKLHPFPVDQGVDGPAAQAQDNGTAYL